MPLELNAQAVVNASARKVCVVMHDVAPATWGRCQILLQALDAVASVPITLLVVPEYHGGLNVQDAPDFVDTMRGRLARGDELALHGYSHEDKLPINGLRDYVTRRLYTDGEGEFAALPAAAARLRLQRGVECFSELHWPLSGFVAPAWLMGAGTWQALSGFPFSYVTTLKEMVLWPEGIHMPAPSLTYSTRAAWRRHASHAWNRYQLHAQRDQQTIRLGLHPADADHVDVIRRWQDMLAACLQDRTAVTKADLALSLRASMRHSYNSTTDIRPITEPINAPPSTSLG